MESRIIRLMKVSPGPGFHKGDYYACSFEEFHLQNLRADFNPFLDMFGDEKFTDIFFMTISGNIYRIFQNETYFTRLHNWVMTSIYQSELMYTFTDLEMLLGRLKINERFIFGNNKHSSEVLEIVCVNKNKTKLNISNLPEALIVGDFEMALKGERKSMNRLL